MPQTIRLTITSDLEKALNILHQSTLGTLNTTELIKMAVGGYAQIKKRGLVPDEMDRISARLFYEWAKEDGIAHPEKLKPFNPKKHVRTR
ncbi:MAG: hypothetical protein US96_C0032G0010 [Candidatus Woesebacteria bacterium GW2011_GWB1_38_5b]|uniref:Uncharacterized protein n=1 Tax=Candidatus Woesebacteria bacterium GW2011_GWB1_38_5b TaxID=1618569 RepID=A0A0G0NBE0_9BACT|nr:MAG: hypothetical protein US96_C0032G0010 [Candidatus Woesebacteria bacterium GW2011_GWB1_38_5b]